VAHLNSYIKGCRQARTANRATFFAQMLESVISQLTDQCEIVVFDNASSDDTEQVISGYMRTCA
jgi:glycosyltransferase involved in cell wall biosynthesis